MGLTLNGIDSRGNKTTLVELNDSYKELLKNSLSDLGLI